MNDEFSSLSALPPPKLITSQRAELHSHCAWSLFGSQPERAAVRYSDAAVQVYSYVTNTNT